MEKVRKPRSDSKMYQLPKEVLNQIDGMLLNENMKYSDIQHWLEVEHGFKISLSSISNYAVKIYRTAQRIADDLERTKFYLDFVKNETDVDTNQIPLAILNSGLMQKLATAEEEFNEIPIEKASHLLIELNKMKLAERKLELDYKRKMQLAFEALETDLLNQMKEYPDIRQKFSQVLQEFKDRSKLYEMEETK